MTFLSLLNSPVFFDTFLKNENFFNSLKDKFPEILADLTSSRDNPNCSCKNKVKAHLGHKNNTTEKDYFDNILKEQEFAEMLTENKTKIENSQLLPQNIPFQHNSNVYTPMMNSMNGRGRVFKIGKTAEDWEALSKKIAEKGIVFRSFSIVEKENELVVYFI
jgi:hypothetical protein